MPGMEGTMREWKRGTLHSGSKTGPIVTNRKQALAIGMNEVGRARKPVSQGRIDALKKMRGR